MTKTLIEMCRYYKGEAECPYKEQNAVMFWNYEKWWAASLLDEEKNEDLQYAVSEYVQNGLINFAVDDGTPMSLKALLFNRFEQWFEQGPDEFRRWYEKEYRKGGE